jgi:hypothetical protein
VSTTATPTSGTARDELEARPRRIAPTVGRTWALIGAAAGLAGVVGIQASSQIDAVYAEEYAGDAQKITDRLGELVPQLLVLHVSMVLAAVLLVVLAAGLRRRLRAQAPADSLLPDVAAGGLMLTAVAAMLGAGFTTEIVFGVTNDDMTLDPEFGALVGHWVGTIPWLWVGAGVTGVAVAIASLRHAAAPRWVGWSSAVLGGLTLLLGISPLQYLAGFTGPVLVLVLGLGFAFGDRRVRTGR